MTVAEKRVLYEWIVDNGYVRKIGDKHEVDAEIKVLLNGLCKTDNFKRYLELEDEKEKNARVL